MLPKAYRIGVLYSTAESNDQALLKMLSTASNLKNMQLVSVAIDQPRDVQVRMQKFKDKVDFIYVGTSGPIQPTLPVIIAEANKMNIPVFNSDSEAVKQNQLLASYGVNYYQVGVNAGKLVSGILKDGKLLAPIHPQEKDHYGFVSKKNATKVNAIIPNNSIIVE
jgi:putative ABC transport system substrate-binding protein